MNGISKLLSSDGFILVNKTLIRNIGLHEAIIIGELCAEYNYWEEHGKLEDGMFYSTRENIESNTGLNDHYQRKALSRLKELGIIEVTKKGLPAVNYYKIDFDKLLTILSNSATPDVELDIKEINLNNNKQTIINKEKVVFKNTTTEFQFGKKQTISKKDNLFIKCVALIDSYSFSANTDVRKLLFDYLQFRMSVKEKPLYANMWKGMLDKLRNLTDDHGYTDAELCQAIIRQSIERGYLSFYPISSNNAGIKDKPWECNVHSTSYTEEELKELAELEREREAKGMRTKF